MIDTLQFADAVGRKNISTAVGVNMKAVSNAVGRGVFPSSWYVACCRLAMPIGVPCPAPLFGMKAVNPSNVDAVNTLQEQPR